MSSLRCPACRQEFAPPDHEPGPRLVACPSCREALEVEVFPALWRAPRTGSAGDPVTGDEAACYVHAARRAEAVCDQCGRFVCSLCDVQVGAQHWCAACFEAGRRGGKAAQVQRQRTIMPAVAIRLVALSIFLGPFAPLLTLPAVVMAVHGLVRPTSVTGSRYVGMATLSIVGGLALTGLWSLFWIGVAVA